MALQLVIEGDLQSLDFTRPDNLKIVWPIPRDAKRDVAEFLLGMLQQNGLGNINVVAEGAFKKSMLRDKDEKQRPVITVSRTGDSEERISIGKQIMLACYDSATQNFVDVTGDVLNALGNSPIDVKGTLSHETLEIALYDENQQRSDQLYQYVKVVLSAAYETFAEQLNYIDFIRANGNDEVPMALSFDGGTRMVFQRTLTYNATHFDFLEGISGIAQLIQSTFTGDSVDASGGLSQTVDL